MAVKQQLERIFNLGPGMRVLDIALEEISPNPYQPRLEFDELELRELAQSIHTYGIIQPVIVRKTKSGYQLIAGERRYRACKMIGRRCIPAIVQEMDDETALAMSIIENLQRKELNYFEEAIAYVTLLNQFGMTQEELAFRIGKSQSFIANKTRLLKIPEEVRELIVPGAITERHARALLKLNSTDMQKAIVMQIYEHELSVKQTEALVEKVKENNIPAEMPKQHDASSVSMVIRDARIFLNTIKETVQRARKTEIDMFLSENETEHEYELTIRINKAKPNNKILAQR
ncbi:Transcriptional repressor protein, KorB [Syntrophomonas zehnderi OL-4]|uniref:Transcriptional repressor protein, KorB n=1 Tax=Syntrophomonas zehnderi OL-4 TaxID=690567 RepID=A0A0E4C853_9FIRM|nr:nucleoid occlusion protein [Syntrophomonas zehnderi]CFX25478.1 Transcriptional repressor protein, KorB [Syntrophomonas zehnderi OL-4]